MSTIKDNNVRSSTFVKIATIVLLAYTNQTWNHSDKFGASLIKYTSGNGECDLRTQRLLGGSGSGQEYFVANPLDNGELYHYDSDHRSKYNIRGEHHSHHGSNVYKHGNSNKHHTSRSKREENNNEDSEVLSLSQFYVDDNDCKDNGETSSSRCESDDYDDVIDVTKARTSNSKHRISSMDVELHPGHEDGCISEGRKGSDGEVKEADSYDEHGSCDALDVLDTYEPYYVEEGGIRKRAGHKKTKKVLTYVGAVVVSHQLIAFCLATSSIIAIPFTAAACFLGRFFYNKHKEQKKYERPYLKCIMY
ncbi:hypothetical protein AK88_01371 [Plasmodium fragile]|uniref:Uncharacterized protein n=1 Tax=Plasmodium fragile TaxID=5857 RepID=A0A0D9QQ06_PLAFR|nr:uncharacterized protein AK88_01371 [Plasmodium fragile]KJP88877.1 hypothetical protein AK88_01371 [Plasmodium fragile]